MKTLLHVIDTTGPGGAEVVFVELTDRMRREGYRCIPVIRGAGWVNDTLTSRGLEPLILDAKGSLNIGYLRKLIKIIRHEKVSLIQSHLLGSNVYCALAGFLTGVPVVATFHGMVDVSSKERLVGMKQLAMRLGVSWFVTVSRSLSKALSADGFLREDSCSVIFNGIDTSRFHGQRTGWLHKQLGLDPGARIAVSIGNIRPAKGYDMLCRAAARLRRDHPDLHFVVAGDPKRGLMKELNELVEELGVRDTVHFIGFVADPSIVYAEADLFVLSSTSEGFSIATIEALAAGLPAVLTACGGPEEIVAGGEHALLVPPGDPDALAEGIARLLGDAALLSRLGAAGQKMARERFDIETMVKSYAALYSTLLKA